MKELYTRTKKFRLFGLNIFETKEDSLVQDIDDNNTTFIVSVNQKHFDEEFKID